MNLNFPSDYPFKAPKAEFKTQIWHPAVNWTESGNTQQNGSICADYLSSEWSPTVKVPQVMEKLIALLRFEGAFQGVNAEAEQQFTTDKDAFLAKATSWATTYAGATGASSESKQ